MKVPVQKVETIDITTIRIFAKLRDEGSYALYDATSKLVHEREGYVPSFIPEGGDYLDLTIDIDTGQVLNWKKPNPEEIRRWISEE